MLPDQASPAFAAGAWPAQSRARARLVTVRPASSARRPAVRMHFIDAAHTLPDFIAHVLASCGLGLAGILGSAATADTRAALRASRRRQQRLARGARPDADRDWADVEEPVPLPIPPCRTTRLPSHAYTSNAGRVHVFPSREPTLPFDDPYLSDFDRRLRSIGPRLPPPTEFSDLDDEVSGFSHQR